MSSAPDPLHSFSEVYKAEIEKEIMGRRQAAGLPTGPDPVTFAKNVKQNLVGLAISGGGWRSAAFGLGVIQAFVRSGLFRHVDYLSTVSGGGYTGSLISSLASQPDDKSNDRIPPAPLNSHDAPNATVGSKTTNESTRLRQLRGWIVPPDEQRDDGNSAQPSRPSGKQRPLVRRISLSGREMNQPVRFFCYSLLGIIFINVLLFSGVISLLAFAAWAFRLTDSQSMMQFAGLIGFEGDFLRAMFPATFVAAIWLFWNAITYFAKTPPGFVKVGHGLFVISIVLFAMGIAAVLGNGDVDLGPLFLAFNVQQTQNPFNSGLSGRTSLMIAFAIASLPFIFKSRFIQSGLAPRSFLDRWGFSVISYAFLFLVPLLLFGYLAHENISKYEPERVAERVKKVNEFGTSMTDRFLLSPIHITRWYSFWDRVRSDQNSAIGDLDKSKEIVQGGLLHDLRTIVANSLLESKADFKFESPGSDKKVAVPVKNSVAEILSRPQVTEFRTASEANSNRFFLEKWWLAITGLFVQDNPIRNLWAQSADDEQTVNAIMAAVNEDVISNPKFTEKVIPIIISLAKNEKSDSRPVNKEPLNTDQLETSPKKLVSAITSGPAASVIEHIGDIPGNADEQPPRFDENDRAAYQRWKESNQTRLIPLAGDWWRADKWDEPETNSLNSTGMQVELAIREFNLGVLDLAYPNSLRSQDAIFSYVVYQKDQIQRLWIFAVSGIIFLISALLIDLNATTIQTYYRDSLSKVWIKPEPGKRVLPLADLENTSRGLPYHLLNAVTLTRPNRSMNHRPGSMPVANGNATDDDPRFHEDEIEADKIDVKWPFLFSKLYCGNYATGFSDTTTFSGGNYDLGSAMAVSGAAVTPDAINNLFVRIMMILLNLRMGEYVVMRTQKSGLLGLSSFGNWLPFGLFRALDVRRGNVMFVSDGGIYENLGLAPLLARRCRLMFVVDGGSDPWCGGGDLLNIIQRSRARHGIRIEPIDRPMPTHIRRWLDVLVSEKLDTQENKGISSWLGGTEGSGKPFPKSEKHYIVFRVTYPETTRHDNVIDPDCLGCSSDKHGYIVYIKPTFDQDEDVDLCGYALHNNQFPNDSTANLFYEPEQFDAYRELGMHIGNVVSKEFHEETPVSRVFVRGQWSSSSEQAATDSTEINKGRQTISDAIVKFDEIQSSIQNAEDRSDAILAWCENTRDSIDTDEYNRHELARRLAFAYKDLKVLNIDSPLVTDPMVYLGELGHPAISALIGIIVTPETYDDELRWASLSVLITLDFAYRNNPNSVDDIQLLESCIGSETNPEFQRALVELVGLFGIDTDNRRAVKDILSFIGSDEFDADGELRKCSTDVKALVSKSSFTTLRRRLKKRIDAGLAG